MGVRPQVTGTHAREDSVTLLTPSLFALVFVSVLNCVTGQVHIHIFTVYIYSVFLPIRNACSDLLEERLDLGTCSHGSLACYLVRQLIH